MTEVIPKARDFGRSGLVELRRAKRLNLGKQESWPAYLARIEHAAEMFERAAFYCREYVKTVKAWEVEP